MGHFPEGGTYLLVASTGGHLAQLDIISRLIKAQPSSHWVTFDTPQSRSLLADNLRTFVEYVGPRDAKRAVKTLGTFHHLLRSKRWDAVISTGAAIAIPALASAALHGVPAFYLESVSRVEGPSMSGRIAYRMPRVHCFTQHKHWRRGKWQYEISIFDAFTSPDKRESRIPSVDLRDQRLSPRPRKIFVSLGTIRPYRFDALINATLSGVNEASTQFIWQLGETKRSDLPGESLSEVPTNEFENIARGSDLVITHAGVATCLRLVQMGIHPVVVPRRSTRGEHVDDHQAQIARELDRRGLCTYLEVDELGQYLRRTLTTSFPAPQRLLERQAEVEL